MYKVLIFGAGSIGNHMCFACRRKNWHVEIYDIDPEALRRTRQETYPSRYGDWDDEVILSEQLDLSKYYDLVILGTPPDSHVGLAIDILSGRPPNVLLVEKPFCTPDFDRCEELLKISSASNTHIVVGYNHTFTKNSYRAKEIISQGCIGAPLSIHVRWQEHWGGIFAAHPWLNGPSDSYLGDWRRGGGACGEHSHGINLWQYFASLLGGGRVTEVTASLDMVESPSTCYDRTAQLSLLTENGLTGSVTQDVISRPAEKMLRVQGEDGFLEWYANFDDEHDVVIYGRDQNTTKIEKYAKVRPDDFVGEIDHIEELLRETSKNSPISLEYGLNTMLVIAAAHKSNEEGRTICIPRIGWDLQ